MDHVTPKHSDRDHTKNPSKDDPETNTDPNNPPDTTARSYLVPDLKLAWTGAGYPPSFNKDPKQGEGSSEYGPAGAFSVNLAEIRTQEGNMLTAAGTAVTAYQELKSKVLGSAGTVFGQESKAGSGVKVEWNAASQGSQERDESKQDSQFAGKAREFAASMNPAQEKALEQIANALEYVGQFIALGNKTGQGYAQADRHSVFPDPPAQS